MIQNSKNIKAINEKTVFQVSTEYNLPAYVGGAKTSTPISIPSIGSEDFPFISVIRGVTTQIPASYIQLSGGEVSNTSVIGNVKVIAYENQIDKH